MSEQNFTPLPSQLHKEAQAIVRQQRGEKLLREIPKRSLVRRNRKGDIVKTPKVEAFLEEFLKNGGSVTKAAAAVGNYTTLGAAAAAGSRYLKEARQMARIYLERKGYGYGKLLDVAAEKLDQSKTPDWWDRLMKLSDYHDFIHKERQGPAIVNVIQSHKKLISNYVEGEPEDIQDIEPTQEKT